MGSWSFPLIFLTNLQASIWLPPMEGKSLQPLKKGIRRQLIVWNYRFKTNVRLCLSISDYHPDTWNPAWSVSTILTGLLSFMVNLCYCTESAWITVLFLQAEKSPTLGSIELPDSERRRLAHESLEFNLKNKIFCQLFPDTVDVRSISILICMLNFCIKWINVSKTVCA